MLFSYVTNFLLSGTHLGNSQSLGDSQSLNLSRPLPRLAAMSRRLQKTTLKPKQNTFLFLLIRKSLPSKAMHVITIIFRQGCSIAVTSHYQRMVWHKPRGACNSLWFRKKRLSLGFLERYIEEERLVKIT